MYTHVYIYIYIYISYIYTHVVPEVVAADDIAVLGVLLLAVLFARARTLVLLLHSLFVLLLFIVLSLFLV